jgi:hypothetical protein
VVAVIFIAVNSALSRFAVYVQGRLARGRTRAPDAPPPVLAAGPEQGVLV